MNNFKTTEIVSDSTGKEETKAPKRSVGGKSKTLSDLDVKTVKIEKMVPDVAYPCTLGQTKTSTGTAADVSSKSGRDRSRKSQHGARSISAHPQLESVAADGLGAGGSKASKKQEKASAAIKSFPGISYCPQSNPLDPLLTTTECIRFYGRLRGIRDLDQFLDRVLDTYELRPYKDVQVRNLSGGNRRKLTVAVTCCGCTPTVLMDEPTSDMDPVTRDMVYATIEQLLLARRAVVLTSHSVSEIEHLCQRVAVLRAGQVIASDSPQRLKSEHGGYYSVTCFCGPAQQAILSRSLSQRLPGARDLQHYAHSLRFLVRIRSPGSLGDAPLLSELFAILRDVCVNVARFSLSRCRFETVFERILDSSESNGSNGVHKDQQQQDGRKDLPSKSPAVGGTLETGYIHCGYEETRT
ncbi:GM23067 [Drosophila sechellia]|uniref:GM23067 n=1 Tax=Drosophila sechellia TaxID=7238 RepID=B4I6E7_DROSE|nr:GM23067 [Drosophila sechellia]